MISEEEKRNSKSAEMIIPVYMWWNYLVVTIDIGFCWVIIVHCINIRFQIQKQKKNCLLQSDWIWRISLEWRCTLYTVHWCINNGFTPQIRKAHCLSTSLPSLPDLCGLHTANGPQVRPRNLVPTTCRTMNHELILKLDPEPWQDPVTLICESTKY